MTLLVHFTRTDVAYLVWNPLMRSPLRITQRMDHKGWEICGGGGSEGEGMMTRVQFCVRAAPIPASSVGVSFKIDGSYILQSCRPSSPPSFFADSTFYVPSSTPVLLLVRTFERQPLRENAYGPWKWNHVGDVGITPLHAACQSLLPSFIPSDEYVLSERLEPHQWVFTSFIEPSPSSRRLPLEKWTSTKPPLYEDVVRIKKEWIEPELFAVLRLSWSADVQSVERHESKVTTPMNYRIHSFPLVDLEHATDTDVRTLRSMAGLSAQSPWYFDRKRPAVTNRWVIKHLKELWDFRGTTREKWLRTVEGMCKTREGGWTPQEHDALATHARLIELHAITRPYNYDHQMVGKDWKHKWIGKSWKSVWVADDDLQDACLTPGDCEDSAVASYRIHMTLLFPPPAWESVDPPVMLAVRKLAAIAGFPCGVCGTGADPCTVNVEAGGHMYAALIPFPTFYRAITGETIIPEDVKRAFNKEFDIDVPMFHTKPIIVESILHTTAFYSDRGTRVSLDKQAALKKCHDWVGVYEGKGLFEWVHYSALHPMNKHRSSQGHAFRMFTEAHLHVWKDGFPTLRCAGGRVVGKCRSFVPYQPVPHPDPKVLFPERMDNGVATVEDYARVHKIVSRSYGYGLSIQLLAHGNHHENSTFQLHATIEPSDDLVARERRIRTRQIQVGAIHSSVMCTRNYLC